MSVPFRVNCGCIHIMDEEGYELDNVIVRKEIAKFAIDMEVEMSKKDEKYKSKNGLIYTIKDLIKHLKSERKEVDFELDNLPSIEVNTELVHEAIMTMIVSNKIKEISKELKYE